MLHDLNGEEGGFVYALLFSPWLHMLWLAAIDTRKQVTLHTFDRTRMPRVSLDMTRSRGQLLYTW